MPARLEVIAGPMFSGKTEELLRRVNRATWSRKKVVVVKPRVDTRSEAFVAARAVVDGKSVVVARYPATVIAEQRELADIVNAKPDVLAISEGQFFADWLLETVTHALEWQKAGNLRIIVDGLDRDYRRQPFGVMPQLLLEADDVTKLHGICMACGDEYGIFTQRLVKDERQIVVGDIGDYQVRCRNCHYIP